MPSPEKPAPSPVSVLFSSAFQLPTGKQVELVIVQLPDGRVVARTVEELERLQPTGAAGGRR